VADFGMARDLTYEDYYISRGGHVPVKWTAPEVVHMCGIFDYLVMSP